MIEIDWKFDEEYLEFTEISKIHYKDQGIYLIFDSNKNPLYVGIANELRNRLHMHFKGQTNTHMYSHLFSYCSVIYEKDPIIRDIFELYLIKKIDPPLNRSRICDRTLDGEKIQRVNVKKKICKGVTLNGNRCRLPALEHGFCHYHGKHNKQAKLLTKP